MTSGKLQPYFVPACQETFYQYSLSMPEKQPVAIQNLPFLQDGISLMHLSNKDTMLQCVENIIVRYVEAVRENIDNEDALALVSMDNSRGK